MPRIEPCLWFNGNAEEAARFYATTFPDSVVERVNRAPGDYPAGKAGDVLTVEFVLLGMRFIGLNAGSTYTFTPAVSFQIHTDNQAETDHYWAALTAEGGAPGQCGWCTDRFGLSWQVVPRRLLALMTDADTARAKQAMEAMMGMQKIDIAALERAFAG